MDNELRKLERLAATGDEEAAHKLERARNRFGESRVALLRKFVGRDVYVEGARLNYLGLLLGVTSAPDGSPAELLFSPLHRVGEWGREGPEENYTMEIPTEPGLPACIPWTAVDQFGLTPWPQA